MTITDDHDTNALERRLGDAEVIRRSPHIGTEIRGLGALEGEDGLHLLHAGTRRSADGRLLADGGRVLGVTALGPTLAEARARAYTAVDRIDWPEGICRRDIAGPGQP